MQKSAQLWRKRDFLLLMGGQTISTLGSNISGIAAPFLILSLTHSPAQAGISTSLEALPYILLSLPGGALVDRWDRKRVMILCDVGRGINLVSLLVMLIIGHLTIVQIYINSLIEGTFFVFFNIAETVCIPSIVEKKQLSGAYAVDQTCANIASLIGPSLGTLFYAIRNALPFLLDIISYFISAISLFFIQTPLQRRRLTEKHNLWEEIKEGFVYLWGHPIFRFMALYGGGLYFVLTTQTLIVIILGQQQKIPSVIIGLIFTFGSIGGTIGAALAAHIQKHIRFGSIVIGFTWIFFLLWFLYIFAANAIFLGILTSGISFIDSALGVIYMSYRMSRVPDQFRGRLSSTHRLFAFGLRPLGTAAAGFLLQYTSTTTTILFFSSVLLILSISTVTSSNMRNAAS